MGDWLAYLFGTVISQSSAVIGLWDYAEAAPTLPYTSNIGMNI
jgi:hypothetical protein